MQVAYIFLLSFVSKMHKNKDFGNAVIKFIVRKMGGTFLTIWTLYTLQRRTLLRGIQ